MCPYLHDKLIFFDLLVISDMNTALDFAFGYSCPAFIDRFIPADRFII
jgi:hypothetical protein